jgi:hypothetical protein
MGFCLRHALLVVLVFGLCACENATLIWTNPAGVTGPPSPNPSGPAISSMSFNGDADTSMNDISDDAQIAISWITDPQFIDYDIEYSKSSLFTSFSTANSTTSPATIGGLESGQTYFFRVRGNLTASTAVGSKAFITIPLVVSPVYSAGPKWNDYIDRSDESQDANHQSDIPCAGTGSSYLECVHAGELRRVILHNYSGTISDCTNGILKIQEVSTNYFKWSKCKVDIVGGQSTPVFYSNELNAGIGLSNLIDFSSVSFQLLKVKVTGGLFSVAPTSNLRKWWTNPVLALPGTSGSGPTSLIAASNTIFVDTNPDGSDITSTGYRLASDGIGLVIYPAKRLIWDPAGVPNTVVFSSTALERVFIYSTGNQRLWIEGHFDGQSTVDKILRLDNVSFSRVQNSTITGNMLTPTPSGIAFQMNLSNANSFVQDIIANSNVNVLINQSDGNYFHNFRVSNTSTYNGLSLINSSQNVFNNLNVANSSINNIEVDPGSSANVFSNVVSTAAAGLNADLRGPSNTVTAMTAMQSQSGVGIMGIVATNNIVHSLTAGSTSSSGIGIEGTLSTPVTSNTTISQVASYSNPAGIKISGDLKKVEFHGNLLLGVNSNNCDLDPNFSAQYELADSFNCSSIFPSSSTSFLNVDLSTSFYQGSPDFSSPTNYSTDLFLYSTDFFRSWGHKGGTSWPSSGNNGICTVASQCSLFDWSLNKFANFIRTTSDSPDSPQPFVPSSSGATVIGDEVYFSGTIPFCPNTTDGTTYIASASYVASSSTFPQGMNGYTSGMSTCSEGNICKQYYLKNAIERIGDWRGDDDGLCEKDEDCIYTPNYGAYQGEGLLIPCTQGNGGIIPVHQMFVYQTNGR